MLLLDLTLPTPEENLALDEALLLACDEKGGEVLRFWESPAHFVVLGISSRLHDDVDVAACSRDGVPILRRASGGGTVLQGPGSLSFSLVLSLALRPELRDLRRSYEAILGRLAGALGDLCPRGTSDLALGCRKVSGNAQKRTRNAVLHHGTIILGLDLDRVSRWLKEPEKQPDYRARRRHADFIASLPLGRGDVKARLREAWGAEPGSATLPDLGPLIRDKYGNPAWTERF